MAGLWPGALTRCPLGRGSAVCPPLPPCSAAVACRASIRPSHLRYPERLVSGFKDTSCICRYLTGGLIRGCSFCLKNKGGLQREAPNFQGNADGSTFCLWKTALLKGLRSLKWSAPNSFLGANSLRPFPPASPRARVETRIRPGDNCLCFCGVGVIATGPDLGVSALATDRMFKN